MCFLSCSKKRVVDLRDFAQFDEWQVPTPRQVLHLQLEPLATATAHRGLRPGAR
jgi:hypothetical protein